MAYLTPFLYFKFLLKTLNLEAPPECGIAECKSVGTYCIVFPS